MKKLFLLVTLVFAVFALASCETVGTGTEGNISSSYVYDRVSNEWVSLDEMSTLRVAMDLRYPPFETTSDSNVPEGISVDIAYFLGAFIGRKVEIVNTGFGSIIPALEVGEVDIAIASMSITAEREEKVDFSNPYFYFKIITLVNKDFATANNVTGDTTPEQLRAIEGARFTGIASQVSSSIPAGFGINVLEATDLATAVENVVQGTADILIMSANPVVQGYNANPNDTMVVWSPWVASPIGMAVQNGNSELLAQANAFIETFNTEGGLYDILSTKWDPTLLQTLGRYGLEFYINQN